jgi:hypothetical protein
MSFELKLAEVDNKDIIIFYDVDRYLWIGIRPIGDTRLIKGDTTGNLAEDQVNGQFGGDINRFVNEMVIPKFTKFLKDFFGKDLPPPVTFEEKLRAAVSELILNVDTMELKKK